MRRTFQNQVVTLTGSRREWRVCVREKKRRKDRRKNEKKKRNVIRKEDLNRRKRRKAVENQKEEAKIPKKRSGSYSVPLMGFVFTVSF